MKRGIWDQLVKYDDNAKWLHEIQDRLIYREDNIKMNREKIKDQISKILNLKIPGPNDVQ